MHSLSYLPFRLSSSALPHFHLSFCLSLCFTSLSLSLIHYFRLPLDLSNFQSLFRSSSVQNSPPLIMLLPFHSIAHTLISTSNASYSSQSHCLFHALSFLSLNLTFSLSLCHSSSSHIPLNSSLLPRLALLRSLLCVPSFALSLP